MTNIFEKLLTSKKTPDDTPLKQQPNPKSSENDALVAEATH